MHEHSLVKSLLRQVEVIRQQHNAAQVSEVRVAMGPLSGVEPLLLQSAFQQLATHDSLNGARLVIDELQLLARCETCNIEFTVSGFTFRCPECNGNVRTTSGDNFTLVSIDLSDEATTSEPIAKETVL